MLKLNKNVPYYEIFTVSNASAQHGFMDSAQEPNPVTRNLRISELKQATEPETITRKMKRSYTNNRNKLPYSWIFSALKF